MANSQDSYYLSLLALAETFRTDHPPRIRHSIHCLQAVLTCDPPPKVAARTHLQIATLLSKHTTNVQLSKNHLQQAWNLSQNITGFDEVRFAAVHQLCNHFLAEATPTAAVGVPADSNITTAKNLLLRAMDLSVGNPHWHCRLLLHTVRVCVRLRELNQACEFLQQGCDYTAVNNLQYMRTMFLLTRVMVLMQEGTVPAVEIQHMLTQALNTIDPLDISSTQKEHLKMFSLVLLTTNQLNMGQVKNAKPVLKQLQHSIQTVSLAPLSDNEGICSEVSWLNRGELGVLVYLVSVRHSMHAGYMDKAHKYTEKALSQISKIKESSNAAGWLEALLVEHTAMCHLVMGGKVAALGAITRLTHLLREQPALAQSQVAQVHTLLAVYAMVMNDLPAAEQQFNAALRTSENRELWTFANLNLGLVYLRSGREQDFLAVRDRILPDAAGSSHSLRAAAYFVQGMHAFYTNSHDDAKRHLREALKITDGEDLNRLTSCALLLLGHLFFCAGSPKEAANMASPAMKLAIKIQDLQLQLWAASILKDFHRHCGESGAAAAQEANHQQLSEQLQADQAQAEQLQQHHALLAWTTGPLPLCQPLTPTSLTSD